MTDCPWRDDRFKIHELDLGTLAFPFDFQSVRSDIGDPNDQTTVGKRRCRLRRWFGTSDFVMMVFMSFTLLVLGWRQDLEAEELDLAEQVGWLVASVRSSLHRYAGTVIYAIHSSFPASLPSVYF